MTKLKALVRTRVGLAALAGAVVLGGGGIATAAVVTSSTSVVPASSDDSGPSQLPTTDPAGQAAEPETVAGDAAAVSETPASVAAVTETSQVEPEQPAVDAPPAEDAGGQGAVGDDGHYTPAPPVVNAGDPPLAPNYGSTGSIGGGDVPSNDTPPPVPAPGPQQRPADDQAASLIDEAVEAPTS